MIVLVGFMGAGKSTVGPLLAAALGGEFVDSDAVLERRLGCPVAQVFAQHGEAFFRDAEHRAIRQAVRERYAVLSLGGGALEEPRTQAVVREHTVVHLDVDYATALDRIGPDPSRPVLSRPELADVYRARDATYRRLAGLTVDTTGRTPGQVSAVIKAWLGKDHAG